ncbi:DbpA RNA binding domain-containing protein, partial [Nevskia ramosa]|uniref:DbpA RNA binding domain-containing protein n=1 Tax=Nevskia ramosa TaxID=64002 RepID=UPI00235281E6
GDASLLLDDVQELPKPRSYSVESSPSSYSPPPRREYDRGSSSEGAPPRPARPRPESASTPFERSDRPARAERPERSERPERRPPSAAAAAPSFAARSEETPRPKRAPREESVPMETFRVEVGHVHGVKPGNIVGAIANEAGVESSFIGRIEIENEYSLVDLPAGMPKEIFRDLQKVWVVGRQLKLSRPGAPPAKTPYEAGAAPRPKAKKPPPRP